MRGVIKLKIIFFLLIIFASFPSYPQSLQPICEMIEVNQNAPLYITTFSLADIKKEIQETIAQAGVSERKAKGIVGEKLARKKIEQNLRLDGKPLISIFTYFSQKECAINHYLRNNSDNGIDDIFVVVGENGKIDQNYKPVFHEAKYGGRCQLKLNTTQTICKQLTFQWLNYHVEKIHTRTLKGLDICFGYQNEVKIIPCVTCQNEFLAEATWLMNQLNSGNFYRTASVLCASGTLKIYQINSQYTPHHPREGTVVSGENRVSGDKTKTTPLLRNKEN